MRSYGNRAAPRKNSTPYLILPVGKLNPLPCVQRAQKRSIRVLTFDSAAPSCSASDMIGELTELDVAVINALSARYSHAGEAAFDEAASRLVLAVCAVLAHTRGEARLRELINLVKTVSVISGKRDGSLLH